MKDKQKRTVEVVHYAPFWHVGREAKEKVTTIPRKVTCLECASWMLASWNDNAQDKWMVIKK